MPSSLLQSDGGAFIHMIMVGTFTLLFSHNKKSVSPIFLQNLILPAVAIKLYYFKLLFEHHFCLNNRPFVFSIMDNNFDSGCHSNKI